MTEYRVSTTKSRFDAALVDFDTASAAAVAVEPLGNCHSRDRILSVLDDATRALFGCPIPTLGAAADKLERLFGERLFDETDYFSEWRQLLIGDIRRLGRIRIGIAEPDASGGMDLERVASDWTEALREYARWKTLLEEGPSDAWGESTQGDLVALTDEAEARLLSKHAPHLEAVIKKLELLAEYPDETDNRADQLLILRDLRRFALLHAQ